MKKRGIFVGACFGAFFAVLSAIAIISPAHAAEQVFKIKNAVISNKSAQTEASISNFSDTTATNSIVFHNVGEYVEYTFTFENSDTKTRHILSANINANNNYLSYDYNSNIEDTIASGGTFDLIFKAIYSNEIESPSLAQQQFDTTIKITYENDEGQTATQTVTVAPDPEPDPEPTTTLAKSEITPAASEPSGNNPKTDSDAATIKTAAIIFIASLATFIVFICYKKHHKISAAIITVAAVSISFAALTAGAASTLDDEFTLENTVTFSYSDCTGICYYANSSDAEGAMTDQSAAAGEDVMLRATNFSRAGYGFAGWGTKADGTGTMYGPNQTITMPNSGSLKLYAIWIKSAGKMVGFICADLPEGQITALTDERNNETYAVARLADGNCWTIENIRTALADSDISNVTNRGDGSSDDIALYGYGGFYTGDDVRGTDNNDDNDEICPSGWRVPSGDDEGDYRNLEDALDPDDTQTMDEQLATWTSYPNNFMFAGFYAPGFGSMLGQSTDYLYRGLVGFYFGSDALYDHGNSSYNVYATMLMKPGVESSQAGFIAGQQLGALPYLLSARCVTGNPYSTTNNTERTFTLNYDANGGEDAPEAQTATATGHSYSFTITDEEPTRDHYSFTAWVEEDNKDKIYNQNYVYEEEMFYAGESFNVADTTTLYALWEENCTNIHYLKNNASAVGEMPVQQICPPDHTAVLTAPNFSLVGNGFIGWNTKADGTGTMYGPNQYITLAAVDDIYLYAQWQSAETGVTMQSFNENNEPYASAPQNTVIALRDERDDNVYAVAKLADGHWWMIENLRLDLNSPSLTINGTNTNNPTQDFINEFNQKFQGKATKTIAECQEISNDCESHISFSTADIDRNNPASYNDNDNVTSWYAYGGHYNWYTATAGHGTSSRSAAYAGGDICPANWHIPTGRNDQQTATLDQLMGGDGQISHSFDITNNWLSYPVNFVLAGSYSVDNTGSSRGSQGKIWTGSSKPGPSISESTIGLTVVVNRWGDLYLGNSHSTTNKWYALSVRCMAGHQDEE